MQNWIGPWLTNHLDAVITLFGGVGLSLFASRKRRAETNTLIVASSEKLIRLYQKALDDLEGRMKKQIDKLSRELADCKKKAGIT
ncbi:MAG: hypothetical protein ACUZ8H_16405 [Candidatus Anammoxibacter sp.]